LRENLIEYTRGEGDFIERKMKGEDLCGEVVDRIFSTNVMGPMDNKYAIIKRKSWSIITSHWKHRCTCLENETFHFLTSLENYFLTNCENVRHGNTSLVIRRKKKLAVARKEKRKV